MNKVILNKNDYHFDASEGKITFNGYINITLEDILVITNITDNVIIYNFGCEGYGGDVTLGVLDLDYDTSSMSDNGLLLTYTNNTGGNVEFECGVRFYYKDK